LVGGDLTCKVLDFIELKFKNHGNIMLHMDLLDVKKNGIKKLIGHNPNILGQRQPGCQQQISGVV
jgi:protein tyrosine phosphatase (PTP) superfamily phosphohydrolase (DUF442 family)